MDKEREELRESDKGRVAKKKKVEEISAEKSGTKYKSKQAKKYQTTWETDFPWLVFNADKNKMHCVVYDKAIYITIIR